MAKKLAILLVLSSASCFAASNQIEFDLGHGTPQSSMQAGGSSDHEGSRGTDWSVDILHDISPQVYLGLGGGYFRSHDNVSQTFVANANSTIVSRQTSVFVLTRADFSSMASSKFVPYFIAGLGWVKNSLSVTSVPGGVWPDTGTSEQRTLLEDSKDTVGFVTGIGADFNLTDRLFIGVEGRYQTSLKRTFDLTPAGQTTTGQSSVQTPLNLLTLGIKAGIKY